MNDENLVAVLGQQIRIAIRWGTGVLLVLCNESERAWKSSTLLWSN
ncbi:MAG TPA: hypothetical protein VHT50_23655 [Mycobacterium sp.]|jgi:hypothetical protein|nr:hypothetical protein [Mycobacterium sp.]